MIIISVPLVWCWQKQKGFLTNRLSGKDNFSKIVLEDLHFSFYPDGI